MGLPTLLVLFLLTFWDLSNFKCFDQSKYRTVFTKLNKTLILFFVVIGLVSYAVHQPLEDIGEFIFGAILVVYFYGREKLSQQLEAYRTEDQKKFFLTCDLLYVATVWLFGSLIFSLIMYCLGTMFPNYITELDEILCTTIVSTILILYLIDTTVLKIDNKGFWYHVGFDQERRSKFKTVILPAFVGLLFALSSVALIFVRPEQPQTPLSQILEGAVSPLSIFLFLILATIVAPFVEEIVFRGYFYNMLCRIKGQRMAIYVSAFSFAIMHVGQYWGDWAAIGIIAVLGLALTLFRVLTHTTLASVIMHYTYNGGVAVTTSILIARDNPELLQPIMILF